MAGSTKRQLLLRLTCLFFHPIFCHMMHLRALSEVGHVKGPWEGKIVLQGANPAHVPMFETNVFDSSHTLVGRVHDVLGSEAAQLVTIRCRLGVLPDTYVRGEILLHAPAGGQCDG